MSDQVLLERGRERDGLRALVVAARDGTGAAAVIEGPAGIGKTSLLGQFVGLAKEAGVTVLRARGGAMERDFPYGVVRQLFEREALRAGADSQALEGAAQLAAPALGLGESDDAGDQVEREFALSHGLYWLVSDLAERRPLACVVDDLHDVDPPSLRFLLYLIRRVQGLPLALVAALRTGAPAADASALAQLVAEPSIRTIRPRGLSHDAVRAMVAERVAGQPSDELVGAVLEVTGGNPFLVEQLLTAAVHEALPMDHRGVARIRELVPEAVTRSVLVRLEREPRPVGDLARAVAVLGDDVELRHAAGLAGLEAADAADAADRLVALSLLRPGLPLGYLHPLLRSTVLAGMSTAERAEAHLRAAAALEADAAPAAAVAAHLLECEPAGDSHTVEVLRAAASAALQRGAADIAARQLERALREPPPRAERGEVLFELGQAATLAGDPAAACRALDESVELAAGPAQRTVRRLHAFRAHFAHDGRLDPDEIMGIIGGIEGLGEPTDAQTRSLMGEVVSAAATNLPQILPEVSRRLEPYEDAAGDTAGERMMLAALSRVACYRGDSAERAAAFAERALGGRVVLAEEGTEAVSFFTAVYTLIDADRLDPAEEQLAIAMEMARRRGSVLSYAAISACRALIAYQRGDLARTLAEGEAAMETGSVHGVLVPMLAACLVRARLAMGDVDAAAALVAPLGDAPIPELAAFNHALTARAQVRFAQGETERAAADIREMLARGPMVVGYSRILPWRQFAVPILQAAGARDEARAAAEEDVPAARRWGTPAAIGGSLTARARCLPAAERPAELEQAIGALERSPARLDLAAAQLLLGDALLELERPEQARDPLWDAAEIAQACGAEVLVAAARDALQATGARPRRLTRQGVDALTPRERRVAGLAAQGLSNREIAESLFVTAKTVENQLGRAYSKLGIAKRAELAGALTGS